MEKYCIVLTTCSDNFVKQKIINYLFEAKICACIQVKKVDSYYLWDNKIQKDDEYQIIIKTKTKLYPKIEQIIYSLHNYEVPQIISIPILDGSSEYLQWIEDSIND